MDDYIYVYIYIERERETERQTERAGVGVRGLIVTVGGNEHGDLSSNPGLDGISNRLWKVL